MDFFGIGPLEVLFIALIMIIVLGPNQMVKTVRTIGRLINRVRSSLLWKDINNLRNLPQAIIKEAELDEFQKEINDLKKIGDFSVPPVGSAWTDPVKPTEEETPPQSDIIETDGEPVTNDAWTTKSEEAPVENTSPKGDSTENPEQNT